MKHSIEFLYLSQEDLVNAGAFDLPMAMNALEDGLKKFHDGRILFPDKIVQIFNEETQDRINCLPATLLDDKICGMKWVSVFPGNPRNFGTQNLSALTVLSSIENGYPVCVMDGTMCSTSAWPPWARRLRNILPVRIPRSSASSARANRRRCTCSA